MQNPPKVSVIIPSLDGYRNGNVEKLIADVGEQTLKDVESKVIKGIRPNGRARNVGAKDAKGRIFVFIDDDIRLGHAKVLENLIAALDADAALAMAGASVKIPEGARYFQKEYDAIREFSSPVKDTIDYQGRVGHACLAIKRSVFEEIGGESDDLIRGTDVDLNMRIKARGYKVAVVPNTWVYHLVPPNVLQLAKEAFDCGLGSAYAARQRPGIFGVPQIQFGNHTIKIKIGLLLYKIINSLIKLLLYILTLRSVYFLFYFFHTLGYIKGWVQFKSPSRTGTIV